MELRHVSQACLLSFVKFIFFGRTEASARKGDQSFLSFENISRKGALPGKLGRGVWPASQNLYLFMTKIYDFPYPIYDLTKNLIPYL